MSVCDEQLLLSAYLDGELDAAARDRVEQHVRGCAACAAELGMLRDASRQLREYPFEGIRADELADLHRVVEEAGEQRIWRIGGTIGLIAASVMIIGMAWLKALPAPSGAAGATVAVQSAKPQAAWEKTAVTLRAEPLYSNDADWMLEQLAMGR